MTEWSNGPRLPRAIKPRAWLIGQDENSYRALEHYQVIFYWGSFMNTTVEQVLASAMELPDEDRLEVVEALIASFDCPDQPPFDDSWREVIRARSAELKGGRVVLVPWTAVKERVRSISTV